MPADLLFPADMWTLSSPDDIFSPQLLVFREHLEHNLRLIMEMAGPHATQRLRPHCKTHKMPAIIKRQLALGITRHKAATFAEAEMLAQSGVRDIVLGYNLVGPNIRRAVRFLHTYPEVDFSVTVDAVSPAEALSNAMVTADSTIGVLVDINPGRDRTGLPAGEDAQKLYQHICDLPGLRPNGLHVYDGHFHQSDLAERLAAVEPEWQKVLQLRDSLEASGCPVPRLICGGTPTFPVYSQFDDPALELSPGTCVFHDVGYHTKYPDLQKFRPAAVVLTRVISRPTADRLTLDMGTKSVASDPPMGQRAWLPALPDAEQVLHNEEHLVLVTPQASDFQPGDWLIAIPRHVCPTSALHREAVVIENGEAVDRWPVTARDRQITI